MNLIAAVDKSWGIGKDGKLLYSIPEDMKFFRKTTLNKVVIMGRSTLESFPGGKPLANRVNIVLSGRDNYKVEGALVVKNREEALALASKYPSDDVFVIGGKMVYELFLNDCSKAYITKIEAQKEADTLFPNIDLLSEWKCIYTSETFEYDGVKYTFNTYEKI